MTGAVAFSTWTLPRPSLPLLCACLRIDDAQDTGEPLDFGDGHERVLGPLRGQLHVSRYVMPVCTILLLFGRALHVKPTSAVEYNLCIVMDVFLNRLIRCALLLQGKLAIILSGLKFIALGAKRPEVPHKVSKLCFEIIAS